MAGSGVGGFTVRRAAEEDIEAVMEINMQSLPENYWYGFYKYLLSNWGEAFLVAEAGGEVVGYSMTRIEYQRDPVLLGLELGGPRGIVERLVEAVKQYSSPPLPVGHLVSIAVKREYRRRGIGSALLRRTIEVVSGRYNANSIYLEVRVSNEPAIRLYEKHGFVKARVVSGYYSDGEDAYIMVKRLKEPGAPPA